MTTLAHFEIINEIGKTFTLSLDITILRVTLIEY